MTQKNGNLNILMLEDIPIDSEMIERELQNANILYNARRVASKTKFLKELEVFSPDLVLADYSLPQFSGLEALKIVREKKERIPFILVTGMKNEEIAVECLKEGADDYILKSSLRRLPGAIQNALEKQRAERENERLEEELRRSQKQMLTIFESITDAFFSVNKSWYVMYLNPRSDAFLVKVNKRREDLWGKNWWNEFPSPVDSVAYKALHRAMAAHEFAEFEEYNAALDSWLQVRAYPAEDGLAIYMQDISERKRDEEKIREQAKLLDIAQDAIIVRDLDDNIVYWNSSAERIYGWKQEEALSKNASQLLNTEVDSIGRALQDIEKKGSWFGELHQITKMQKSVIVESRWSIVRDEQGKPHSILTINTDITDKKNIEQQFLRAQRLESVGTLASGILHDLNNVLTPIILAVPFMREKLSDEASQDILRTLESSAKRGEGVVKQLMSFVRGVKGDRVVLQLKLLVWELLHFVGETFPPNIKVTKHCPKGTWFVVGDSTQLYQVLMNLAINARDAMPNGGTLTIDLQNVTLSEREAGLHLGAVPGMYVVLSVKDTGSGIPPEIINRIFDPFFTTKEPGKGTGLGLSSALSIVKSHGGFIDVHSEVDKGTDFNVYLPAKDEEAVVEVTEDSSVPMGHGETILVVDDEKTMQDLLRPTLEKKNFKVMTAYNGDEAITLYRENQDKIDVVLLDMLMPKLSGLSTIPELRLINPQIKIIGMTGSMLENLSSEMNAIMQELPFLQKPFNSEDVAAMVNEVLCVSPTDGSGE
ncbi:MAG: hybrid sensor histidine kinase/response regulator [Ignavibacteriae bacterium]|nr:MAG: hybrid sensor histidine kinase/response regulator [Ignavibacteriota bacterium]